ncbi:MAG: TIGR03617 family F420-dependent LLM class oxidoreductase [Acidobacteria bacterium]|nr:TIGR03617 family F420-dependent LLM class oxidoreductase [Acidobacteriota bacterium]
MLMIDAALPSYELASVPTQARRLEELGFGAIWTQETRNNPFLPLAVAATVTSSIRLGTAIAVAFPRSPMVLAYLAWDLQRASRGRFILGLGSQVKAHNERRFSVPFDSPGPRLREVVLSLRAIWEAWQQRTMLNFSGQFYRFSLMTPFFDPGPLEHAGIPVYVAGVNRYMCRMAGEVCNGLHVHPFHSVRYLREYVHPAVGEGLRLSGRSRSEFTLASSTFAAVGDTEDQRSRAAEAVRRQVAFYASTRTYEPVLATHGWEGILPELHRKSLSGDWDGMAALISDEMLATFAVTGTLEQIGVRLRERYAGGLLDRTALYEPEAVEHDDDGLRALIRTVAHQE